MSSHDSSAGSFATSPGTAVPFTSVEAPTEVPAALPSRGTREDVWDLLRGVGVLGIFSLHVFLFAYPYTSMFADAIVPARDWPWMLAGALGNGKFITLLAITFGAGVAMMSARAVSVGVDPRPALLRRFAVLAALGAAHYALLFYGDILQYYAFCGLAVIVWVARASDRVLAHLAGWSALVSILIGLFISAMMVVLEVFDPDAAAEALFDAEWHAAEVAAYTGSYLDAVRYRVGEWFWTWMYMLIEVPFIIGLMALGMLAWRRGWLSHPSRHPRVFRWGVTVGLVVGIPINLLTALATSPAMVVASVYPQRYLGGLLVGVALALLLARWAESARFGTRGQGVAARVATTLRAVGRRSLTCYLFQSVVGGFVFYSWGLGQYDRLSPVAVVGVLVAVWVANVALALTLERLGMRGPAEWVWRRLAPTPKLG